MINAIAIDTDSDSLELLKTILAGNKKLRVTKTFDTLTDANRYMRKFPVDIVFCDMELHLAANATNKLPIKQSLLLVFTSDKRDNAVEAFNLSASDFLLKPYTEARIAICVDKLIDKMSKFINSPSTTEQEYLNVRVGFKLVKIKTNEILYLESIKDYVMIYLEKNVKYITRGPLKVIKNRLCKDKFIQVNRSYVVTKERIKFIKKNEVNLGTKAISIGPAFKDELKRIIPNY